MTADPLTTAQRQWEASLFIWKLEQTPSATYALRTAETRYIAAFRKQRIPNRPTLYRVPRCLPSYQFPKACAAA